MSNYSTSGECKLQNRNLSDVNFAFKTELPTFTFMSLVDTFASPVALSSFFALQINWSFEKGTDKEGENNEGLDTGKVRVGDEKDKDRKKCLKNNREKEREKGNVANVFTEAEHMTRERARKTASKFNGFTNALL